MLPNFTDFYRFVPIFRTFLGDFNPQKLPSRRLQTLWEWKNRVLLEEYYIFNVAIPLEVEREQSLRLACKKLCRALAAVVHGSEQQAFYLGSSADTRDTRRQRRTASAAAGWCESAVPDTATMSADWCTSPCGLEEWRRVGILTQVGSLLSVPSLGLSSMVRGLARCPLAARASRGLSMHGLRVVFALDPQSFAKSPSL